MRTNKDTSCSGMGFDIGEIPQTGEQSAFALYLPLDSSPPWEIFMYQTWCRRLLVQSLQLLLLNVILSTAYSHSLQPPTWESLGLITTYDTRATQSREDCTLHLPENDTRTVFTHGAPTQGAKGKLSNLKASTALLVSPSFSIRNQTAPSGSSWESSRLNSRPYLERLSHDSTRRSRSR